MNNKRGLHFVTHNTHNLIAETAMGHGENLGALAMTMGCDWRAQPVFNDVMKANFNLIYGAAESAPEAIYEHMLDAAAGDSMLAQSCSALNI